ncbi:NAD-dependent epimerase/dehydratase family protein [Cloacibacterium sp. TD35]|uniref:NAD-dependent epimerase/dehydratase family protein n=1 Tax=Cloacibacterium sp. TD35 TaxID=2976818 RepID=UPI00237E9635|nr:NAD-dependent epimerase/dehydratase family protein [Cloacibacterium sp. TD35]WDT67040.1 NAD-dependent epimerase/dehydratase family protein [Cloacibacterium sp. TD35]
MNILITGGAGFIGSNLSLRLLEKGYQVTVLDNLLPQVHGENPEEESPLFQNILGKVNFIKGDVTKKSDWLKAIKQQDSIIHLAALTGTGQSMYQIDKYTDVNVSGTAKMLDVLVNENHQIKKVILASSRAVYGEGKYFHKDLGIVYPKSRNLENMEKGEFEIKNESGKTLKPLPTDESSLLQPISVYGITKQIQEQLVMSVCSSVNIDAIALRFQNVYGAGQSLQNPYTGILSIFSSQILNDENLNIFEDGEESRDFIYIDDAVEAIILSLENTDVKNKVFNIGTGVSTTVLELAKTLKKYYNKDIEINISGQFRIGDIRHNFADISLAQEKLSFFPKVSFEEGIRKFTTWVLKQNMGKIKYNQSLHEMIEKGLLK